MGGLGRGVRGMGMGSGLKQNKKNKKFKVRQPQRAAYQCPSSTPISTTCRLKFLFVLFV